MQHEKFYDLQRTAYFIYAPFVFKMKKILFDQFSTLRTRSAFGTRRIPFLISPINES